MEKAVQAGQLAGELRDSFFDDAQYSDVTIKYGTQSLKAHKVILARGSDYFKKMLGGPFEEANKKDIELIDDDPVAVPAMLRFLYNMNYSSGGDTAAWQRLTNHAHVYAAAEKYSLSELKKVVTEKMRFLLSAVQQLKQDELFSTLKIIWASTPSHDASARPLLATHCARSLETLQASKEFVQIMRDTELGADVCLATINVTREVKKKASEQAPAQVSAPPASRGGITSGGRGGGAMRGAN